MASKSYLIAHHRYCQDCGKGMKSTVVVNDKRYDRESGRLVSQTTTTWWHCQEVDPGDQLFDPDDPMDGDSLGSHDAVVIDKEQTT